MNKGITVAMIAMGLSLAAQAASDSWNVDANGNWWVTSNWLGGVAPGVSNSTASTDAALFTNSITAGRTVTVDNNRAIGTITFGSTSTNGFKLATGQIRMGTGGVIQTLVGTGNHNDSIDSKINLRGLGNSVFTFINSSTGNTAGLVLSGDITSTVASGKVYTITLDGISTTAGIGTGARNNWISGDILDNGAGDVAVVKNGTGLWTLTGANNFNALTFNAGTLRYFGGKTVFGAGTITVASNGVSFSHANSTAMTISNQVVVLGNFTLGGADNTEWAGTWDFSGGDRTLTVNAATTISGSVTNAGRLTKNGADILKLTGANTFTQVLASAGTLIAASDDALGNGKVSLINSAELVLTNGVLDDYIGDLADFAMGTNNTLALDFSGTDTVHSISLDNGTTLLPAGTYTAAALALFGDGTYTGTGALEAATGGSAYDTWANGYSLSEGQQGDDDDDGLLNIYEYGLGGDPTNSANQGISPVFGIQNVGGTNYFGYIHPQLSDPNSGISYHLEINTDLVAGSWTNAGYLVYGTNVTGGTFDYVTNITTTGAAKKFIRLIIE